MMKRSKPLRQKKLESTPSSSRQVKHNWVDEDIESESESESELARERTTQDEGNEDESLDEEISETADQKRKRFL
jgi:hypothetical protein